MKFMQMLALLVALVLVAGELGQLATADESVAEKVTETIVKAPAGRVKKPAKVKRTIRVKGAEPALLTPVEEPSDKNVASLRNVGATNNVDVQPNISIQIPPVAQPDKPAEQPIVQSQAPAKADEEQPAAGDVAEVLANQSNNQILGAVLGSNNANVHAHLLSNNRNEEMAEGSHNVQHKLVRNSGNREEIHLDGVGNSKITRISNANNQELEHRDEAPAVVARQPPVVAPSVPQQAQAPTQQPSLIQIINEPAGAAPMVMSADNAFGIRWNRPMMVMAPPQTVPGVAHLMGEPVVRQAAPAPHVAPIPAQPLPPVQLVSPPPMPAPFMMPPPLPAPFMMPPPLPAPFLMPPPMPFPFLMPAPPAPFMMGPPFWRAPEQKPGNKVAHAKPKGAASRKDVKQIHRSIRKLHDGMKKMDKRQRRMDKKREKKETKVEIVDVEKKPVEPKPEPTPTPTPPVVVEAQPEPEVVVEVQPKPEVVVAKEEPKPEPEPETEPEIEWDTIRVPRIKRQPSKKVPSQEVPVALVKPEEKVHVVERAPSVPKSLVKSGLKIIERPLEVLKLSHS